MAKLSKDKADKTAAAEGQDYSALPPGIYHCKLTEVQTERNGQPLEGNAGPYWVWVFQVVVGDRKGRKIFLNTSLSDDALWKLNQVFTGMGFTTDSDTDEMIGERATLVVSQRVIEQGQRKGQMGNNVDAVQEYTGPENVDEDGAEPVAAAAGGVEF